MLTFVVPTFNEPENILTASLRAIIDARRPATPFEILVVDDSTPDHEGQVKAAVAHIAVQLGTDGSIQLLHGPGRGKGAAVRQGALVSRGDIVFLVDADIPVPLHHIAQFAALLTDGADIVIAERPLSRHTDPVRRMLSRGLLLIQSSIVFHSLMFKDTQCGFKAFRGDVLRTLAAHQVVERGMYDLEYLYMAAQAELIVVRIPVAANPEIRQSRIDVLRCLPRDPYDVLRVKARGVARRLRGIRIAVEREPLRSDAADAQNPPDSARTTTSVKPARRL